LLPYNGVIPGVLERNICMDEFDVEVGSRVGNPPKAEEERTEKVS